MMPNATDLLVGWTPDLRMDLDLEPMAKREPIKRQATGRAGTLARVTARLLSLIL